MVEDVLEKKGDTIFVLSPVFFQDACIFLFNIYCLLYTFAPLLYFFFLQKKRVKKSNRTPYKDPDIDFDWSDHFKHW